MKLWRALLVAFVFLFLCGLAAGMVKKEKETIGIFVVGGNNKNRFRLEMFLRRSMQKHFRVQKRKTKKKVRALGEGAMKLVFRCRAKNIPARFYQRNPCIKVLFVKIYKVFRYGVRTVYFLRAAVFDMVKKKRISYGFLAVTMEGRKGIKKRQGWLFDFLNARDYRYRGACAR